MKPYKISIKGEEFTIEPALHEGMYAVSSNDQSALVGKDSEGKWEIRLPTSQAIEFPVKEIGAFIDGLVKV